MESGSRWRALRCMEGLLPGVPSEHSSSVGGVERLRCMEGLLLGVPSLRCMCACSWRWQRSGGSWAIHTPPTRSFRPACPPAAMGLQQSRQGQADPAPKPAQPPPARSEPSFDGLVPRSLTARAACNRRRVRRLVLGGRLAPCWERDLPADEGEVRGGEVAGTSYWPIGSRREAAAAAAAIAPALTPARSTHWPPCLPHAAGVSRVHGPLPETQQHGLLPPGHL